MPSSPRYPRPRYGQLWSWEGNPPFMLINPLANYGEWIVIQTYRAATPYSMFGLYPDRDPIKGYTFIGGPME
jgi:hypothetical protein